MNQETEIILMAFVSIAALVYLVSSFLFKGSEEDDKLRSRLVGKGDSLVTKKEAGGSGVGSIF